jgi:hypothetical protein
MKESVERDFSCPESKEALAGRAAYKRPAMARRPPATAPMAGTLL